MVPLLLYLLLLLLYFTFWLYSSTLITIHTTLNFGSINYQKLKKARPPKTTNSTSLKIPVNGKNKKYPLFFSSFFFFPLLPSSGTSVISMHDCIRYHMVCDVWTIPWLGCRFVWSNVSTHTHRHTHTGTHTQAKLYS